VVEYRNSWGMWASLRRAAFSVSGKWKHETRLNSAPSGKWANPTIRQPECVFHISRLAAVRHGPEALNDFHFRD